jgi:ABC-2 type transport system permease protein
VLSTFILLRAFASGPDSFDLAVVGDRTVADRAAAIGERAADRALRAGDVDAVVIGDAADILAGTATLQVFRAAPSLLDQVVQAAAIAERIDDTLADAGVSDATIEALQDQHPVDAVPILPPDPDRDAKAAVALAAVLILYGQLFGYGVWVATGVIEEKSSRVVEVLLSTIRARQLMAGKIAGIGTLGLLQLILISIFAVTLPTVTGAIDIPVDSLSAAAITVGWFVLGFSFYAGAIRHGRGARLPDGGVAVRDRADQPRGVRLVHHLDRRRRRSGLRDRQDRFAPADLVRAGDAGPHGAGVRPPRGRSWHRS